jgi:hypothetical protein
MILESNVDVISSLRTFYKQLGEDEDFPDTLKAKCKRDLVMFASRLDHMICDFKMEIARAKLLAKVTTDRKELVCCKVIP